MTENMVGGYIINIYKHRRYFEELDKQNLNVHFSEKITRGENAN